MRLEQTRETATDVACQWNKTSSKGVHCKPIANISFYSEESKKKILKTMQPYQSSSAPTEEEKTAFLTALSGCKKKVITSDAFIIFC